MPKPRPNLRDYEPLPPEQSPLVTVVIPARNEAANVERCLRSILASEYRKIQVILVDDRSTDDTAVIAERVQADDARLMVIRGAELPKGWYGKPWACWQAFQAAQGTVLLFTDADTVHSPTLLPLAVAALETERADAVTVMPHQEMLTFWERVVQPWWFLLLGLRFGSLKRLNKNRNPRHAIANGQFILATRDSYEWIGGHKKVFDTVIEDLMLAVRYTEGGKRIFFALADEDMTTRMYSSLPGIIEGWSKNFFRGAMQTTKSHFVAYLASIWTVIFLASFLLPPIMLVLGLVTLSPAKVAFGASAYIGASLLFAVILRASRAPPQYGFLFPLGALVSIRIVIRAMTRGTKRIEWKGRTYAHG
jgi:chlorobactene glucosyltransferase